MDRTQAGPTATLTIAMASFVGVLLGYGVGMAAILAGGLLLGLGFGIFEVNNMPILCQFVSPKTVNRTEE